ncbi:Solute carrier family 2, facilitated glucose transporter member 5 [Trichinella britovi]|uniref:Solute carrier family 2, facilitated glucose transporter member 5 n=1 Tax=Trichinella britovi TaxID=45882 RepID=A0A0V1D7Q6_TRIBR|nr:Solute carrier family 2, facilitated glucose transporter member 5 [Trichinella britovi]
MGFILSSWTKFNKSGPRINLVLVVVAIGMGTQFQIYNASVLNNLIDKMTPWFNESYYDHYNLPLSKTQLITLWSITVSCVQIGAIFGSLLSKVLAERLGRRLSLLTTGCLCILSSTMMISAKYADSFELFMAGRLLLGLCVGASVSLGSLTVSELAPVRYRGACGSLLQMFMGLGNTLSLIITLPELCGNEQKWPIAFVAPLLACLFEVFVLITVKDTPQYLWYSKRDEQSTKEALHFYRHMDSVDFQFEQIKGEIADTESRNSSSSLKALFSKRQNLLPFLMAFAIVFSCQFTGFSTVMAFSKSIFLSAGLEHHVAVYANIGLGILNFLTPLCCSFFVDKSGRRIFILSGLSLTTGSLCALAISAEIALKFSIHEVKMVSIPCLFAFQIGYSVFGSVIWAILPELFRQDVRSMAMSIIVCCFFGMQVIVLSCYLHLQEAVGLPLSVTPFIIIGVISITFFYKYLPETKGKSIMEISEYFCTKKKQITKQTAYQPASTQSSLVTIKL